MARRIGLGLLALLLLAVAWSGWSFYRGWAGEGPLREPISFTVADGATLTATARQLEEAGAIDSASQFLGRVKLLGAGAAIKAGEYALPRGASNRAIFLILTGGRSVNRMVTIPEGMPAILVYERLMAIEELTGELSVPAEGSVLPDSYAFESGESRAAVLARMQQAMADYLARAWANRSARTIATSPQEAVILASIVEKETSVAQERPTVAGVYTNRLRQGMMLQADPTIIYPITKGKPLGRRIRKSEIAAVNDYNTYAMTGLPKGPIANPGRASIDAVLNPARTAALYFVADGRGGHIFANTLAEHNENVRKWFEIRRARGEM